MYLRMTHSKLPTRGHQDVSAQMVSFLNHGVSSIGVKGYIPKFFLNFVSNNFFDRLSCCGGVKRIGACFCLGNAGWEVRTKTLWSWDWNLWLCMGERRD